MFYLVIDIGKRTHAASIMSDTEKILLTFLLVWKPQEIIGSHCFRSWMRINTLFMSLIPSKSTVGAKEQKSENEKMILLIRF